MTEGSTLATGKVWLLATLPLSLGMCLERTESIRE